MKKTTLKKIKEKLETMRVEIKESIKARSQEGLSIETEVQDEMDQAQEATDKALLLNLADKDKQRLQQIEVALRRIEEGTYGICVDTEEDIEEARLLANPFALRTVEAQEAFEKKQKNNQMRSQAASSGFGGGDGDDD